MKDALVSEHSLPGVACPSSLTRPNPLDCLPQPNAVLTPTSTVAVSPELGVCTHKSRQRRGAALFWRDCHSLPGLCNLPKSGLFAQDNLAGKILIVLHPAF